MSSNSSSNTMRAVVWEGKPFEVAVRDVPKPRIQAPEDAIVRITAASLCGSDLHVYHGFFGSSTVPFSLGHEAIGVVVEAGSATETFKPGDRVVIPAIPDEGHFVTEPTNIPGLACYGLGKDFGNLGGCQAEYVRVPFADDSLVHIDSNSTDDLQYLFLSDIFATGWAALDFSGFQSGDSVAVFGAGPVGLLCAYSALLRGASKVFVVDHVKSRLEKAASMGAIPIDYTEDGKGAAALILEKDPEGVIRSCDCCGYECVNVDLKLQSDYIMQEAIKVKAVGGGIGAVGLYADFPPSEGAPNAGKISGKIVMDLSTMFNKRLSFKTGSAPILELNPRILQLVQSGRAKPSFIVSSEVGIEDAPSAYRKFDQKLETKVVIRFPWEWTSEGQPLKPSDQSETG
ncbi:hypothetical protein Daus18300_011005 [Diaporthe australafricana]|uniref:Alcohol dehydrogenase-like N-terminal domain-containing protein n=1 Tax=Diaporthe australafricana TaxID=127596 RepID=A0ABR3W8A2_9PEZI